MAKKAKKARKAKASARKSKKKAAARMGVAPFDPLGPGHRVFRGRG
jgi:hypothetical protein